MSALRALRPRSGSAKREPFAAFVCDESTRTVLAEAAVEQGWPESSVKAGGISEALATLPGIPTPRLLVIDLSESPDPITDAGNLAQVCDENTRVIILGMVNDVGLFRALVDLGVDDYLLKPISSETLSGAMSKAFKPSAVAKPEETLEGRCVTVIGARGGVGATSVAVNTAWLVANDLDMRVALVDFDLHFGTVALSLDLEPGRGFGEALEAPDRIDGLFLERAMVRAGKNLSILGSERMLDQVPSLSSSAIGPLLDRLRSDFEGIVLDVPRTVATAIPELLTASQCIVLVSDLSLAGMRDTLRLAEFIRVKAPEVDLRIVVNRTGSQSRKGEMSTEEFERNSETQINAAIPDDVKSAVKAAGSGRPLAAVAPKGRFASVLRGLVPDLMGVESKLKNSLWQRLSRRSS